MNRNQLIAAFVGPRGAERAADEVLRLRDALNRVGGTNAEAKAIAEAALAEGPKVDTFQSSVRRS